MVRKMLVKMLVRLGSAVDEACDGQVAIDIIREKLCVKDEKREEEGREQEKGEEAGMPYDVILMDSVMPRVTGLQATETIVQLGFTGLIVGVTGNVLAADVAGTAVWYIPSAHYLLQHFLPCISFLSCC